METKVCLLDFQEDWERIIDKGSEDYKALTKPERVWFNVECLMGMVDNGGLASYFCEDTVTHLAETMEDLKLLGATVFLRLLEETCKLFPNGWPPEDFDERCDLMGNWDENTNQLLEDLDEEFYLHEEHLEKSLVDFIIKNRLTSIRV